MGVHGLWKLIDAAGKPVPIESLENKILAIDVSIWLHQLVKGFLDKSGKSVQNAHLLGLFHRICKLLFFRIKPVFVFDGGVPTLKKKTIAARQRNRSRALDAGDKLRATLLQNLMKQHAIGKALGEAAALVPKSTVSKEDSIFVLPPLPVPLDTEESLSDSSDDEKKWTAHTDIYSVEVNSKEFSDLPADIRHNILTELKESRSQNSWAKIREMPEDSSDFSSFQMNRLLKRRSVQVGLEQAEQEMGGRSYTLADVKTMLTDQGVDLSQRIASDNTTRFIYATSSQGKLNFAGPRVDSKESEVISTNEIKLSNYKLFESAEPNLSEDDEEDEFSKILGSDDGNSGLSQQEIYQLIQQQNKFQSEEVIVDDCQPSTSKTLTFPEKMFGKDDTVVKAGFETRQVNDSVHHQETCTINNELSKVEHETVPQVDPNYKPIVRSSTSAPFSPLISEIKKGSTGLIKTDSNNVNDATIGVVKKLEDDIFPTPDGAMKSPKICDSSIIHTSSSRDNMDLFDVSLKKDIPKEDPEVLSNEKCETELSSNLSIEPKEIEYESESSTGDDDFLEVSPDAEIKPPVNQDSDLKEKRELECESSEEDDLLEVVEDNPKDSSNENALEIIVNTDKPIEDDMFADIFKSNQIDIEKKQQNEAVSNSIKEEIVILDETPKKESIMKDEASVEATHHRSKEVASKEELLDMREKLEEEERALTLDSAREERLASTITEQLVLEAQELLQLFGLPFIVAPMEAEAQCAYLDETGQTQGTISDDSDIWLFGGRNVYKNFFDQKKFVLQFKAFDIERCFKLRREDLVLLALLTGSDYTVGLNGVGPVTAMEILASFPPSQGDECPEARLARFLKSFRDGKLAHHLATKLRSVAPLPGFPNSEVVKAYMYPTVSNEQEPFSWAVPDLARLRQYTRDKFGWNEEQTDKTLLPVFEKLKQNQTQKTLFGYFDWAFDNIQNKMSKRVEKAVALMGSNPENTDNILSSPAPSRRIRSTIKKNRAKKIFVPKSPNLSEESDEDDKISSPKKACNSNTLSPSAKDARARAAAIFAKIKEEEKNKKKLKK